MAHGIALALLSALLFGASTPFAKIVLGQTTPAVAAGLLYLGAGLGLTLVIAATHVLGRRSAEAPLTRADLPWLGLAILSGGVAGPLCLMTGLARTDAASASLALNLEGVATLVIAWVILRENVDRRLLLGAACIVAGAVVLSWQGAAGFDGGTALIALACLFWGIDNNLTRRISGSDALQITAIKGLVAGSVTLSVGLSQADSLPPFPTLAGAAAVGFLGYGVSLVLFVRALRALGTARTGAYFSLAPFAGAVLSVAMLGDPVSPALLVAGALMAVGLWLHLSERHDHDHAHVALDHVHRHRHDDHHRHDHPPGVDPGEPHSHPHHHPAMVHRHPHFPDLHHRHVH